LPELDAVSERAITPSYNPRFDEDASTLQRTSNTADDVEDNLQSLSNVDNMLGLSENYYDLSKLYFLI